MKWLTIIVEGFNMIKKLKKSLVINVKLDEEVSKLEDNPFLTAHMKAGCK